MAKQIRKSGEGEGFEDDLSMLTPDQRTLSTTTGSAGTTITGREDLRDVGRERLRALGIVRVRTKVKQASDVLAELLSRTF